MGEDSDAKIIFKAEATFIAMEGMATMEHVKMLMSGFLADLHSAKSSEDLMKKYGLTTEALEHVCGKLNTRELTILRGLWLREQLSESQFMRAFSEPEELLRTKNA